jgi:uncharacterized protein (DUF58 family)
MKIDGNRSVLQFKHLFLTVSRVFAMPSNRSAVGGNRQSIASIRNLYLSGSFYTSSLMLFFLFVMGYLWPPIFLFAKTSLVLFGVTVLLEIYILFYGRGDIQAERAMANQFSNGDINPVQLTVINHYPVKANLKMIDELPPQFQNRNFQIKCFANAGATVNKQYHVKPTQRGVYHFGCLNIYVSILFSLIQRRYRFSDNVNVKVYPSFMQVKQYEIFAVSHRLNEMGVKKIRQIGHTMEFDQIRNYIKGDDYRTVNWKATARRSKLMVNQYQNERSQHIYSIIDMGRLMKMPFDGMTLLDYAINSALTLSNVAIRKQDKAGVLTFSDKVKSALPASNNHKQMHKIMELLYGQKTQFEESDFERLYPFITHKIKQRSLILFYTNFDSLAGLQRQLGYLIKLSQKHLLTVVFFKNEELEYLQQKTASSTEALYTKTIAQKFAYEKKQILYELQRYGIHHIFTKPKDLTVSGINKYLEIKARGLI